MTPEESSLNTAVVFADVSGSSQLYVTLGDAMAQSTIAKALDLFAGVTKQHKGIVIKTIGDEIMCRFPTAKDGFDAAVAMQRQLKEHAGEICAQTRIGIRVGLHWGEAVLQAGDIFGDAVNVAARVAAVAKRDQIVTTEQTIKALPEDCRGMATEFDRVAVKGRVGEIGMFMVQWDEEADATRMRTVMPSAATTAPQSRLQLAYGESSVQLFTEGKALTLGRSPECSLVVATTFGSRLHARVVMRRGKFVLVDESTNGTYILPGGPNSGAQEIFIKREEFILPAKGVISLGQSCTAGDAKLINFATVGPG